LPTVPNKPLSPEELEKPLSLEELEKKLDAQKGTIPEASEVQVATVINRDSLIDEALKQDKRHPNPTLKGKESSGDEQLAKTLIKHIDTLIVNYKLGETVNLQQVEDAFADIIEDMLRAKLIKEENKNQYLQQDKHKSSPLRKDILSVMKSNTNDYRNLKYKNLESYVDKLMEVLGKVCDKLNCPGLAKSCRSYIANQDIKQIYTAEKDMSKLLSKVEKSLKGSSKVGAKVEQILAERQQGDSKTQTR